MTEPWRPSASVETLQARAALLRTIREFFHARGVMEVDVPALSRHGTVDPAIDSFRVPRTGWLHTSPEFGMKRLLAAGSGPIYQLSHVFRADEAGRFHNPEFMLLEWYRTGWNHTQLMVEVEALARTCLGLPDGAPWARLSYREAFTKFGAPDPFAASPAALRDALAARGIAVPADAPATDHDFWLHLWMGTVVGPALGAPEPVFVQDFPASQAALARIRGGEPPVAERFELFWCGQELANGFHELTDAHEQRARFRADRARRKADGKVAPPADRHLLAALKAGVSDCAGVALGVDRLLMLKLELPSLAEALPFDAGRA